MGSVSKDQNPFWTFTMLRDGSTQLNLHAVKIDDREKLNLLIESLSKISRFLDEKEPG